MEKYHKTDICPIENENERDENYVGSNTCIRTVPKQKAVIVFRSWTVYTSVWADVVFVTLVFIFYGANIRFVILLHMAY